MPSREELIEVAGDALMDADCTSINDLSVEVANALLARWPHIAGLERVESDEEAEALPIGVVVRSEFGTIAARFDEDRAVVFGHDQPIPWGALALPLAVLHRPDATNPEEGTR